MNNIKYFFIDLDGTITNGQYRIADNGGISKDFYTRDFYAISKLIKDGYKCFIITSSKDRCIDNKLRSLNWDGISIIKTNNKKQFIISKLGFDFNDIAYIGDAENDIECIELSKWAACPKDAIKEVKDLVHYVSDFNAGFGAIYDIVNYYYSNIIRKAGQ